MHAIAEMTEKIIESLEKTQSIIGIFLDLSKAFDTINHQILLEKLAYYGIRGSALTWFQNYLSKRTQCVQYNEICSENRQLTCGVPQGSILGPLLFLLYMNDLPNICKHMSLILFADDTNAFCCDDNIDTLYRKTNKEMEEITDWFSINKLSLNVDKTNYMLFTNLKLKKDEIPKIYINKKEIEEALFAKFLGVYLDKHLTWAKQIEMVTAKVARGIGVIQRLKPYMTPATIKTLYCTLVLPHLTYCNAIWTNTHKSNLTKLQSLQKKALKLFSKPAKGQNIFKSEKLLKLKDIGKLQMYTIVKEFHHNTLPQSIASNFTLSTDIHKHNTRTKHNLHTQFTRTEIGKR
jgi:hypothetical protein